MLWVSVCLNSLSDTSCSASVSRCRSGCMQGNLHCSMVITPLLFLSLLSLPALRHRLTSGEVHYIC